MKKYLFNNNVLADGQEGIKKSDENAYEIALANGDYRVRVYAGDLNDEGDVNVHVNLNGKQQRPIWVNDRSINSKEFDAQITDGKLCISFSGKYVCIQGIELAKKKETVPENGNGHASFAGEWKVTLTWEPHPQEKIVHIYKNKVGSGTDPVCITTENCGVYQDAEVELCETYEYSFCFADELNFEGKRSKVVCCLVADEAYDKAEVSDLYIREQDESSVSLTWKGDAQAISYVVYRKPVWGKAKKIAEIAGGVGEIIYTDCEVVTDRAYLYQVEAKSVGGISERKSVESAVLAPLRRRQMEALNRGVIAVKTDVGIFLSWRMMPKEVEQGIGFLIYVNGTCCNEKPYYGASNYTFPWERLQEITGECENYKFEIRTVGASGRLLTQEDYDLEEMGMYMDRGNTAAPWEHNFLEIPLDKPAPYTTPDGNTYEYSANDASLADLDGDGEYEIILKWDCNGKDNSHKGYSGLCLLDAYKLDGTKLWRINLGHNIRCGAHYTQFMVYDFDGDGYAEMVCKTADGTVDGEGNVIGDATVDYRNADGFILNGPEYLTLFDGKTGVALDTVEYVPGRGTIIEYGDSWGNRVDRFLACVAYLDGVHPSAVMCRGYYDHGRPTNLTAYDVIDKKLVMRWKFRADSTQNINYTNQGFHNLAVADVDGDGCDEIIYGACVIDHDGTGLYSTGLEHGDAMHVGRFTSESVGFDYYGIHEHRECPYGMEARDAGTGEIRWGKFTGRDTERGLTAKIDPRHEGNQMWAKAGDGMFNYKDGQQISENSPSSINFAIWWDGDLLRELFDHEWYGYETGISRPRIYKWDWENETLKTIFATDDCAANNGSKGNPCLQASIFGDWREDVVLRTIDSSALRIYTTTDLTEHKFYTFMADEVYRLGIAWQNTAYNQPPQTSFYIGDEMKKLPIPQHRYIGKKQNGIKCDNLNLRLPLTP